MYSSVTIANFFIVKALEEKIQLTPMQLLSVVYFAHGWFLGNHGKPLIRDQIQAWHYGPVIPYLYHMTKHLGPKPLKRLIHHEFATTQEELLPEDAQNFLNLVWQKYRGYSGVELAHLSHLPAAPWALARKKHPYVRYNVPITNTSIERYFRGRVEKARQEEKLEAAT